MHTRAPSMASALAGDAGLADDALAPEVAERHLRVDADEWDNIYVVGDVHGCAAELDLLLEALSVTEDDLVVFVGDLVRKGPDSLSVVQRVRDAPNMLSVRGNNEDKIIHGRTVVPELESVMAYLESLPVVISFADVMVVHGGYDTRHPLAQQDIETLLNARAVPPENGYDGPFWFEHHEGPRRVLFGHTVLDEPVHTEHAIGLDTGCVYGGSLTAYDVYADEFVSVRALETYRERADEKILDLPTMQA